MQEKPYQQGGVVGAKPDYTGGQARHTEPAKVDSDPLDSLRYALGFHRDLFANSAARAMTVNERLAEHFRGRRLMLSSVYEPKVNMGGAWEEINRDLKQFERFSFKNRFSAIYNDLNFLEERETNTPVRISAAQIHAELYAKADVLLQEPAPFDLTEPEKTFRISSLMEMGFANQPEVLAYTERKQMFDAEKEAHQNDLQDHRNAMMYRMKFPNYKFITQEQLDELCLKYDLSCRLTHDFIGDIPDKNVADMARFKEEISRSKHKKEVGEIYRIAAPKKEFRQQNDWAIPNVQFINGRWVAEFNSPGGFSGVGSGGMQSFLRFLIDDPIVLAPVKHGFLIVTAWGDEANDPDVLNEQFN